ncbi:UNVERIFIED_CONTAM: hydrolase 76 protein [Siphonaria sp. JEL0065]|nr:hydrolase 76 protein [Siphonaria sp. JEL0065]
MHKSLLLLVVVLIGVSTQQTIDVSNKKAVASAVKAAMEPLQQFFPSNNGNNGAWIDRFSSGQSLIPWRESGLYWDLFYKYAQLSGDQSYNNFADENLQKSIKGFGNFLNGASPTNRSTERFKLTDCCEYIKPVMTAAETKGRDAILAPNSFIADQNPTYFSVANRTFSDVWMVWDESFCDGGIGFSSAATTGVKSAITNAEEMGLGARLFRMTKNLDYQDRVDAIYSWMKAVGIIGPNYVVYDGVNTNTCDVLPQVYSHASGELLSALSIMYQATNDTTYLQEASNLFTSITKQFTSNNILNIEPSCLGGASCNSPTGYFWSIYKGISDFYAVTPNKTVQATVVAILTASAINNFKGCDSNWYCIRNLQRGTAFTMLNGTNPRDQFETVALLNSLMVMTGSTVTATISSRITFSATIHSSGEASSKSSTNIGAIVGGVVGGIVLLAIVVAALCYRRRQKESQEQDEVVVVNWDTDIRSESNTETDIFLRSDSLTSNAASPANLRAFGNAILDEIVLLPQSETVKSGNFEAREPIPAFIPSVAQHFVERLASEPSSVSTPISITPSQIPVNELKQPQPEAANKVDYPISNDEEIPVYDEFSTMRSFRSRKSVKSVRFNPNIIEATANGENNDLDKDLDE